MLAVVPKLSVIVGADSLNGHRSGVGRVTEQLARAACRDPRIAGVHLRVGGRLCDPGLLDAAPAAAAAPSGLKVRLAGLPGASRALRALRGDGLARAARRIAGPLVYHEPNLIPRSFTGPTVITINDLAFLQCPDSLPAERLAYIGRHLPRALRAAARIVAISQFTRDAAIADLAVAPDRIVVVPLAAAPHFRPFEADEARAVLAGLGLWDRSYVLGVSTREPRKNFDGLLAAYLALPPGLRDTTPLVIAGAAGWGSTLDGPAAHTAIARGELRLLGFVPDATLAALYARAACVAFVSHYEGFGLPVVEAMASGTPVVCSRTTATGEIAADAALTVDPDDPHDITEALRRLLGDPRLADDFRRRGFRRARAYSVRAMMDGMIGAWQAVAA